MTLKIFITGIGGFIGSHLAEFLAARDCEVYGSYYRPTNDLAFGRNASKELFNIDVRDRKHLEEAFAVVRPDVIYHLAAQSYPMVSYTDPEYTLESNVNGTLNVFESVLSLGLSGTRIMLASSTAAYGFIDPQETPVTENQPFRPAHVYGMSKAGQDLLGYTYHQAHALDVIRLRIGNCVGPRRTGEVVSDFTLRRARIDTGEIPPRFRVGNLHTKRAFLDVRDALEGFWGLQKNGRSGAAYNISGEQPTTIEELLDIVLEGCDPRPEIVRDPELVRDVDEPIYWSDLSPLKRDTGWIQQFPLSRTVGDMIHWWKERL